MRERQQPLPHSLTSNVSLLKTQVSRHAVYGALIASAAVVIATLLSAKIQYGGIDLSSIVNAQKKNVVLWFLDFSPFFFAFWGQYVGSLIAHEAGSFVVEETRELRSQASELEFRMRHESTHDTLTELPNRFLFLDRLGQALRRAHREKGGVAVILLDLDRFKEINDTLGHHSGDRLLKQVASRLTGIVRDSDTLARLGGDEYAFLLPGPSSDRDVRSIAKKVQRALESPFEMEGLTLDVQASIGAVLSPEHGNDVDTLMQRVDVAMYAAKQEKSGFELYSPELDTYCPRRLTLMGELRQALASEGLELYYQPKVVRDTQTIHGAEALIRWHHPKHGLLPPDEFIPLAERSDLIKTLTRWVIKTALEQLASWHKNGMKIGMSVNVPPPSILDPDFIDMVTGLLAAADLPPDMLTIEITESLIIRDPDRVLEILSRLAGRGIRISIDDFGTGYSSLAYLKRLPASELKIDKSFVMEMLSNENDAMIVRAIIDLAHNLGLEVVAEGVETAEAFRRLGELGCDIMQGFYFCRPVPEKAFSEWFRSAESRVTLD